MKPVSKGLLWIFMPWIVLVVILVLWGIVAFVARGMMGGGAGMSALSIVRLVNVGLGFVGILSVIMIPVGFIVGIIVIVTGGPKAPPQA